MKNFSTFRLVCGNSPDGFSTVIGNLEEDYITKEGYIAFSNCLWIDRDSKSWAKCWYCTFGFLDQNELHYATEEEKKLFYSYENLGKSGKL